MTLAVIRDVVQIVCALATTAAALKYFLQQPDRVAGQRQHGEPHPPEG